MSFHIVSIKKCVNYGGGCGYGYMWKGKNIKDCDGVNKIGNFGSTGAKIIY